MHNPYWGKGFFEFFGVLFSRMIDLLKGNTLSLAQDETQICVLSLIAVSCGIIGCFLVLRKMTMLANSLSHTILLGIVIAYLLISSFSASKADVMASLSLTHLFIASLITAILTTFLTEICTKVMHLQEDASIGLVFTLLFALGIVLVTLFTRNAHIGIEVIMGNVDALHAHDIQNVGVIALLNILFLNLFFRGYFATTFDPSFSKTIGISPSFYHYLLMLQTSVTILSSFRAIGIFLVLSLLVGPTLIARMCTHNLKKLILISSCIGVVCSIVSVALSRDILSRYHISLSTSGLMITLIFFCYIAASVFYLFRQKAQRSVIIPNY